MRLFRRKKKETPKKSKPASIYYSPAAEEAAAARSPASAARRHRKGHWPTSPLRRLETPPTLRTPVRMPNGGTNLDGADLRDTLARATSTPRPSAASRLCWIASRPRSAPRCRRP